MEPGADEFGLSGVLSPTAAPLRRATLLVDFLLGTEARESAGENLNTVIRPTTYPSNVGTPALGVLNNLRKTARSGKLGRNHPAGRTTGDSQRCSLIFVLSVLSVGSVLYSPLI
jgi:hypothetical protein